MYSIDTTAELPRFEFEVDGERYSVELFDNIDVPTVEKIAARIANAGDTAAQVREYEAVLVELFDRDAPGVRERLTRGQWRGLVSAYMEASGLTLGE